MDTEQIEEILEKLDRISLLLAMNVVKGLEPEDQLRILSVSGFQPSEIAPLVGRTPNAVRIALHQLRKKMRQGDESSKETGRLTPEKARE